MGKTVLAIDQSTQGTKALLLNEKGVLLGRADRPHRQIVNSLGWVEHDPDEIMRSVLLTARKAVERAGAAKGDIASLAISNQRETTVAWDRDTGRPVYNAIVWQCARGKAICDELEKRGCGDEVRRKTGIPISPYFPAAKLAWILRSVDGAADLARRGKLCAGTIDSWLVYCLTNGKEHRTDYSNASRTQLFDIARLEWDDDRAGMFGIDPSCLPRVTDSDGDFGETDLCGYLDRPVPIRGVMGDSSCSLFAHGCLTPGMAKATYGTGTSVMMNAGEELLYAKGGVVTSLAWKLGGRACYAVEGNINYSAAVITWLRDGLGIIKSPGETEEMARAADPGDRCCLVPAFSGLGMPYWDSGARAAIVGMSRTTGKNEIARAALECIAFQVTDVVRAMEDGAPFRIGELRADGGASRNSYLMQFQADMLGIPVSVADTDELSGMGAAFAAGIACGIMDGGVSGGLRRREYAGAMEEKERLERYGIWQDAVERVRSKRDG